MVHEIDTPVGRARIHLETGEAGLLALGHGAGGGISAADLVAAAGAARSLGLGVALVEQPYRVAGRRSPAPAAQLDAAWVEAMASLTANGGPLVVGGRSSGARVACRTAAQCRAVGVLCLAFPVHPPGKPEKPRLDELNGVSVPVLVIQGESDPFGMPPRRRGRRLLRVPGNHSLSGAVGLIEPAVRKWLAGLLGLDAAAVDDQRLAADRGRRVGG